MIRAIPVNSDFPRRSLTYMFVQEAHDRTRYYARRTVDAFDSSPGWYPGDDVFLAETGEPKDGWTLVTVTLDRDVASALADAILTETTGIAPTDARALRQDLQHERERRDKLEDTLIGLVRRG